MAVLIKPVKPSKIRPARSPSGHKKAFLIKSGQKRTVNLKSYSVTISPHPKDADSFKFTVHPKTGRISPAKVAKARLDFAEFIRTVGLPSRRDVWSAEETESLLKQMAEKYGEGAYKDRPEPDPSPHFPPIQLGSVARSPSPVTPLSHKWSEALVRALAEREALVESGDLLTSSMITKALGISRQAVNKSVHAQRMIALPIKDKLYYPWFFADPSFSRRQLGNIVKALDGLEPWEKYGFFTIQRTSLGGVSPLDALSIGRYDDVITAAEGAAVN